MLQVAERVRLEGHIIDSLLLPKALDLIVREGGSFRIETMTVGQRREDMSAAVLEVQADTPARLERILGLLLPHGAMPLEHEDATLEAADLDGVFPEGFAASTSLETTIRVAGEWLPVDDVEMDCGIVVAEDRRRARCVPMHRVRRGDWVAIGRKGLRVTPLARDPADPEMFQFMASAVSSEKPKTVAVRDVATMFRQTKAAGRKSLFVGGPAIVHTGGGGHVCRLLRAGFIDVLFAGNALATHDIEQAMFRTSLGIDLDNGVPTHEGHEHHLRAINRIRRCGGIAAAVSQGVLKSGIMFECVRAGVPFLLAGSIRDDGPLPDVVTDMIVAADGMRELRQGVGFCLAVATTLHAVATGNILPASVRVACVDINPATVTKLADRGTNSLGIVSDVEPFLRALVEELLGPER